MSNPTLIQNFKAGAAIAKHRIVKFGADDSHVIQGAAATDALFGVADSLGAAAAEDRVDVQLAGVVTVDFGGTVTRGGLVTSDATGQAVAAAPSAGVNNRVIGIALVSAVDGDLGPVLLQPGQIQGA